MKRNEIDALLEAFKSKGGEINKVPSPTVEKLKAKHKELFGVENGRSGSAWNPQTKWKIRPKT